MVERTVGLPLQFCLATSDVNRSPLSEQTCLLLRHFLTSWYLSVPLFPAHKHIMNEEKKLTAYSETFWKNASLFSIISSGDLQQFHNFLMATQKLSRIPQTPKLINY